MKNSDEKVSRIRAASAALVGLVALAALLTSAESTPPTWDEGDAFNRARRVAAWSSAVADAVFRSDDKKVAININGERGARSDENAARPGLAALFSDAGIAAGWPFAIYREGHPGGYAVAIAVGKGVATRFLPSLSEKVAFRFGPIFLFAAALAIVFYRTSTLFGPLVGVASVVGIATIPRVWGHAQLAGGDSLLVSSWLLAWAFFDPARESRRRAALWGVAVGLSFSAKFSGFAVVVPFLLANAAATVAAVASTRGGAARADVGRIAARTALGLGVATAFFFVLNPPLWTRPISGFATFFALNARRDGFEIPIFFLGKLYNPSRPLPWWNGFFWIATTIPLATLVFAAVAIVQETVDAARSFGRRNGVASAGGVAERNKNDADGANDNSDGSDKNGGGLARRRAALATALALAVALPIVRAFPGTPPHDGARLLIASFPFWGIVAGIGAGRCVERFRRSRRRNVRGVASSAVVGAAVAAAFGVGVGDLIFSAPQYLSFYNAAIGGVAGAARRGMEPTYYWDAFDREAVARLNAEIDAARAAGRPSGVLFGAFSTQTLEYYRRWGTLATSEIATISAPDAFAARRKFGFYVAQRRQSGWTRLDLALMKTARPIWRKYARNPYCRDKKAMILEIYDFRDVERVLAAFENAQKNAAPLSRTVEKASLSDAASADYQTVSRSPTI